MNKIFKVYNELIYKLNIAFIISCLLSIVFMIFYSFDFTSDVYEILYEKDVFNLLLNLTFSYFIFKSEKGNNNFLLNLLCIILCNVLFLLNAKSGFGIFFSITLCLVVTKCFNKPNNKFLSFILFSLFCLLSYIFGILDKILFLYLKDFAIVLVKNPSIYVSFNNFYKLFVSNKLEYLVNETSVGCSRIIEDKLIIGLRQYFNFVNYKTDMLSQYMSSQYIINIFSTFGILMSLYNKLNKREFITVLVVSITTIITGNNLIFMLFILLLNPISYFAYLVLIFLSNVVVSAVNIRIGYEYFPSLIELIKNIEKPIYFIVIGIIFVAISYYLFELVFEKLNADNNFFIDNNVKRIITSLGGLKNIQSLNGNELIVKNPNLINILKIDCEIYGNKVILLDNDAIVLKDYI